MHWEPGREAPNALASAILTALLAQLPGIGVLVSCACGLPKLELYAAGSAVVEFSAGAAPLLHPH